MHKKPSDGISFRLNPKLVQVLLSLVPIIKKYLASVEVCEEIFPRAKDRQDINITQKF